MKELARLVALLRPHTKWVILGILLSLLTVIANIGLLALSSWFVATMAMAGAARATIDYTLPATGVRALALTRAAGRYAERLVNHNTTFRILASLRVWLYRQIEPLSPSGLARYRSGDLLSRIRADVDTLDDFYVRGLVPMAVALLAVGVIIPFLARFSPSLVLIDLAALASAGVLLPLMLKALAERPGRERVATAAALRSSIVEETHGMAELIAFGAIGWHAARIGEESRALDRQMRSLSTLQGIGEAGMVVASSLAVWGVAFVLVPLIGRGALPRADIAMLTVFVLASFEIIMPLPLVIQRTGEMAAAARRLFEVIDARPAAGDVAWVERPGSAGERDHASAADVACGLTVTAGGSDGGRRLLPTHPFDLALRAVGFRYAADRSFVLERFSLALPPGSRVALTGPTGAGKSSVINLLLRFWDYEEGSVTVGGRELRSLSGAQARSLFSVVPQSPYLFHATIRENLTLTWNEERGSKAKHREALQGPTEAALREALSIAQLSELVEGLPDGLDTTVGERGLALSVGQMERVAVARALLKDAPIFLLDEPTEGLDDATADALLETVDRYLAGRSILIITHRKRDLHLANRVVELPGSG